MFLPSFQLRLLVRDSYISYILYLVKWLFEIFLLLRYFFCISCSSPSFICTALLWYVQLFNNEIFSVFVSVMNVCRWMNEVLSFGCDKMIYNDFVLDMTDKEHNKILKCLGVVHLWQDVQAEVYISIQPPMLIPI